MPTEALARLVHDAMGYESHETLKVLDEQEIKDKDELFEYWHDLKELARTADQTREELPHQPCLHLAACAAELKISHSICRRSCL